MSFSAKCPKCRAVKRIAWSEAKGWVIVDHPGTGESFCPGSGYAVPGPAGDDE